MGATMGILDAGRYLSPVQCSAGSDATSGCRACSIRGCRPATALWLSYIFKASMSITQFLPSNSSPHLYGREQRSRLLGRVVLRYRHTLKGADRGPISYSFSSQRCEERRPRTLEWMEARPGQASAVQRHTAPTRRYQQGVFSKMTRQDT